MAKKKQGEDPIQAWKDYQNNQYNPGYFTGGRIPPLNRARLPRLGILLIIAGIISVTLAAMAASQYGLDRLSVPSIIFFALTCIPIVAGFIMIRPKSNNTTRKRKR